MAGLSYVGKAVPRVDSREKVTGEAVFATDIYLPDMRVGKIKTCPHPFARIISINIDKACKLPGVEAVITAKNVIQYPYGLYVNDELPLADTYARYAGDGVAAVAAIDDETAQEAMRLIEIEYEELPYVLDSEEAMKPGIPAVHPERKDVKNNVTFHIDYVRGEGEKAFKEADFIIEDKFATQVQHQCYLEPQACVAFWDSSDKLTLWGGTQKAFGCRTRLSIALGIPESQIRIIQPHVGGAFGGKWEMHPYFAIASLLARAAGKPVKMVYTREEDFIFGRPRPSEVVHLQLGFKKDGTMVAKKAKVILNCGAYTGCCPLVLRVSASRPDCVYRLPNIQMDANLVYTNTIPRGAFRGFGDPEMLFAQESLIDMAAEQMGIDPLELRLKNAVHKGDVTQHGFILNTCELSGAIQLVRQKSGWDKKRKRQDGYHGVGVACEVHNAGNKAAARTWGYDGSSAVIRLNQNGKAKIYPGEMEMGQGSHTVYVQMVAEVMGLRIDDVEVFPGVDSDHSPFAFGTSGSKGTVLGGNAVLVAARDTKKQLLKHAAEKLGIKTSDLSVKESKLYAKGSEEEVASVEEIARYAVLKFAGVPIIGRGEYKVPDWVVVPDDTLYGNFSLSFTFSAAVAEVVVYPSLGRVDVIDIWHCFDIGKVINPGMAEGQVEGGASQGVGYALAEDYILKDGRLQNPNFRDYRIPLAQGSPRVHTLWIEKPNPGSPFGAKAVAEHAVNPIAPAIANAIYHAVGIRVKELPISTGKVFKALREKAK